MKKLRNTIACGVAALALLATGLTSCTGDFDNINTSKDKPTPEDVDRDNAWAAFIQTMQRNVFAEGANAYQLAGSQATLAEHNLDRHWRNARVHTLHDPVRWKYHAVGNYYLNDENPPLRGTI